MAIVRISSTPCTSKADVYLHHDVHRKNKKIKVYLKIMGVLLIISVIYNIIFITK